MTDNKTDKKIDTPTLKTKHVAAIVAKELKISLKPVQLRRVLRAMPKYADGVHTNYRWAGNDKAAITEIVNAVKQVELRKQAAKVAAQAALDKKNAEAKLQAKTDAKAA